LEGFFQFKLHTHVHFGPRVSERLGVFLREFGFRKIVLIVDAGIIGNPTFRRVRNELQNSFEITHELINRVSEPDYDYLEGCREQLRGKEFLKFPSVIIGNL